MGFWGSFLGHEVVSAINDSKKHDDLCYQLTDYEIDFNKYLQAVNCGTVYNADWGCIDTGSIAIEERKIDTARRKVEQYIQLGGDPQYIHDFDEIDDCIEKVKCLNSNGCIYRQSEFEYDSVNDTIEIIEEEKSQKYILEKTLGEPEEELENYEIPEINMDETYSLTEINMWDDDDEKFFSFTFRIECCGNKMSQYAEFNDTLTQTIELEEDKYYYVNIRDMDGVADKKLVKFDEIVYVMNNRDALTFKAFCDKHNERANEISSEKQNEIVEIYSKIEGIDNLASNLLNMIDEKILLNHDVIIMMQMMWAHDKCRSVKLINEDAINDENSLMAVAIVNQSIDNMVEVIQENNLEIDETELKFACWEAVKRNSIKFYSQIWESRYGKFIGEPLKQCDTDEADGTLDGYIENIISCNEIDDEDAWVVCIFTYYMMDKGYTSKIPYFPPFMEIAVQAFSTIRSNMKKIQFKEKLKGNVEKQVSHYSIDDVDMMNGNEFEHFVCELYSKMGYKAEVTKQSGDQGLDVVAERNGIKVGIQAKCYSGTVGNAAVQEAVAGKNYYHCDKVVVATNNFFTPSAIELAQANDVILWNRDILKEKIKELML